MRPILPDQGKNHAAFSYYTPWLAWVKVLGGRFGAHGLRITGGMRRRTALSCLHW